jgi:hypothetical protein
VRSNAGRANSIIAPGQVERKSCISRRKWLSSVQYGASGFSCCFRRDPTFVSPQLARDPPFRPVFRSSKLASWTRDCSRNCAAVAAEASGSDESCSVHSSQCVFDASAFKWPPSAVIYWVTKAHVLATESEARAAATFWADMHVDIALPRRRLVRIARRTRSQQRCRSGVEGVYGCTIHLS